MPSGLNNNLIIHLNFIIDQFTLIEVKAFYLIEKVFSDTKINK